MTLGSSCQEQLKLAREETARLRAEIATLVERLKIAEAVCAAALKYSRGEWGIADDRGNYMVLRVAISKWRESLATTALMAEPGETEK